MSVNVNLIEQNASQINGRITINVGVSVKNIVYVKKIVSNPSACRCENGKYLASIMDESGIICDEITEVKETNFNEKKVACKMHRFYV